MIRRIRPSLDAPIVLFTYANPVVRMDARAFARTAADAGVDGVLILDYPIEEAGPLRQPLVDAGIDPIFLISPTTTDERIRAAAELGQGFLYLISRLGVTGARDVLAADAEVLARRVRAVTDMPLALGFGISRPEHVAAACKRRGRRGRRQCARSGDCRSRRRARSRVARRRICPMAEKRALSEIDALRRRIDDLDEALVRLLSAACRVRARHRTGQEGAGTRGLPAGARGRGAQPRAEPQSRAAGRWGDQAVVRTGDRRGAAAGTFVEG